MIVEDERDDNIYYQGWDCQGDLVEPENGAATFAQFIQLHHEICHRTTHIRLQNDLDIVSFKVAPHTCHVVTSK